MSRRPLAVLSLAVAVLALCAQAATASTIVVANTNDSGAGSLRQAIADASGGDTIAIPAGDYKLNSVLAVNKALTFAGEGARATILDGQGTTRIFSLAAPAANVRITGVKLTNGHSSGGGGAILSSVPLTLIDDALVGNTAVSDGGAIEIAAQLTMDRDLVAGNAATGAGSEAGGIELEAPTPVTSTISNSTIANNSAGNTSGGLNLLNTSTQALVLLNDTFQGNTLSGVSSEGGQFRAWSGTKLSYRNTWFGGGVATSGPNCEYGGGAEVKSLGHNAQDINDPECNMTDPTDRHDLVAKLEPLQDSGGPTDTMRPTTDSPLLDQGDPALCGERDQRGVPRPQGAGCDIGAVERTTPTAATVSVSSLTSSGVTLSATVDPVFLGGSFSYRYGPTVTYGSSTPTLALLPNFGAQPAAVNLTGLTAGTGYHAQLVVTTPEGSLTSPDVGFTTAAASGPATAPAPELTALSESASRWRVGSGLPHASRKSKTPTGTSFGFTLNEAASVQLVFSQAASGRRVGHKCVPQTSHNRHKPKCARTVAAGTLTVAGHAGVNHVSFQGRLSRTRKLGIGRYTLLVTALANGQRSTTKTLSFTIVRT